MCCREMIVMRRECMLRWGETRVCTSIYTYTPGGGSSIYTVADMNLNFRSTDPCDRDALVVPES